MSIANDTIDEWVTGRDVPKRLGISHAALRAAREKMTEGTDWRTSEDGRAVEYALSTLEKICEEKKGAAEVLTEEPAVTRLFVRKKVGNPRIVLAVRRMEDVRSLEAVEMCTVRVKHSDRFVPGMVLDECKHVGGSVFEYVGKPPRRKGCIK
jgi:hypothetical protein